MDIESVFSSFGQHFRNDSIINNLRNSTGSSSNHRSGLSDLYSSGQKKREQPPKQTPDFAKNLQRAGHFVHAQTLRVKNVKYGTTAHQLKEFFNSQFSDLPVIRIKLFQNKRKSQTKSRRNQYNNCYNNNNNNSNEEEHNGRGLIVFESKSVRDRALQRYTSCRQKFKFASRTLGLTKYMKRKRMQLHKSPTKSWRKHKQQPRHSIDDNDNQDEDAMHAGLRFSDDEDSDSDGGGGGGNKSAFFGETETDDMYSIGNAVISFGCQSFGNIAHVYHEITFDEICFDFEKRSIRARYNISNGNGNADSDANANSTSNSNGLSLANALAIRSAMGLDAVALPDFAGFADLAFLNSINSSSISALSAITDRLPAVAIEFRIYLRHIFDCIDYYQLTARETGQPSFVLSMLLDSPVSIYKVFVDTKYQAFETLPSLDERFERTIRTQFSECLSIKIELQRSLMPELFCELSEHKFFSYKKTVPLTFRTETNPPTVSSPPQWTLKLQERVQYLLACLHTQLPSVMTYQAMSSDHIFIETVTACNGREPARLCCALKRMHAEYQSWIHKPGETLIVVLENCNNFVTRMRPGFGLIRHCWITLSGVRVFPGVPEQTNRVLRWFDKSPWMIDHFMRVTVCEDHGRYIRYEDINCKDVTDYLKQMLADGITIGERCYEFLAFGSSQLNEHSVWMYFQGNANQNPESAEDIRTRMGDFSEIKSIAKYAARMGQCFSTTSPTLEPQTAVKIKDIITRFPGKHHFECVDLPATLVSTKEHIECCFSDGVGRISIPFAEKISKKLGLGHTASAFQIRYGGCKGMVTLHPECTHDVEYRPSMNKFEARDKMFEICRVSFFSPAYLNKQIITLFETNGAVPEQTTDAIVRIAKCAIASLCGMRQDRSIAIKQLKKRCGKRRGASMNPLTILLSLLKCNFDLGHPFVRCAIESFVQYELKTIRDRFRILIDDGASLLGVMDEYGVLQENEVFIQVRRPHSNSGRTQHISGKVIICKCPALAPGDMRVFNAVGGGLGGGSSSRSRACGDDLGHLTNVVVFSQKGVIPDPQKMAGSDLDGDIYWVTWNQQLLQCYGGTADTNSNVYGASDSNNTPAWFREQLSGGNDNQNQNTNAKPLLFPNPQPKKVAAGKSVEISDLQAFFVDYIVMDCLGMLASAHLCVADHSPKRAKDDKCLILAVLNSLAVDYKKSGTPVDIKKILKWRETFNQSSQLLPSDYPDFMRMRGKPAYISPHAMGQIYRNCRQVCKGLGSLMRCKRRKRFLNYLAFAGYQAYAEEAHHLLNDYCHEIESIQNRFQIRTEIELFMCRPLLYFRLPGMSDFDMKQKITFQMRSLMVKFRALFFREFVEVSSPNRTQPQQQIYHNNSGSKSNGDDEDVVIHNSNGNTADDDYKIEDAAETEGISDLEIAEDMFAPNKTFQMTRNMLAKASAWHFVTIENMSNDTKKFVTFPFIVADILCKIKTFKIDNNENQNQNQNEYT